MFIDSGTLNYEENTFKTTWSVNLNNYEIAKLFLKKKKTSKKMLVKQTHLF